MNVDMFDFISRGQCLFIYPSSQPAKGKWNRSSRRLRDFRKPIELIIAM
jgi:hypothetical protein